MSKTENKLTEGSVTKTLIVFSLPFIGSFLLQALYSVVDLLIVSHFAGTYSISGLNIVAQLTDMVLGFAIGFVLGYVTMDSLTLGICFGASFACLWGSCGVALARGTEIDTLDFIRREGKENAAL